MHWMRKWPGGFPVALMAPATTEADVDRHTQVFREAVLDLAGYN